MVGEGMEFYNTPLETWLSHTLHKVYKRGGHPIPLREYQQSKEQCEEDLIQKLEEWSNNNKH